MPFINHQRFIYLLLILRLMPVRIPRKHLLPRSVVAFLAVLVAVALTILTLERYRSFALTLILYTELLILVSTVIYFTTGRHTDSDSGAKYSFNSEGILVNKHLVYPWTDIKSIYFRKLGQRFTLTQFSTGNTRAALRQLGIVPSRKGDLVPIYRTYHYGTIEVFTNIGSRPSVTIKCLPSFSRARRLFRKMEKYSSGLNPHINFHIEAK